MIDLQSLYLQTSPVPATGTTVRAGQLSCLYENGFLRYIKYDGREIVRMIYCAVRDSTWDTVPSVINEETLDIQPDCFRIGYTRIFSKGAIRYKAKIGIEGLPDSRLRFSLQGAAETTFLRNRIGLCVHLPLDACTGKACSVGDATGGHTSGVFPVTISPHQPFRKIRSLDWQPDRRLSVSLRLSGEEFEMEDHRNWTDASFKIYGTPLDRPIPVKVNEGETLSQAVDLVTRGTRASDTGVIPGKVVWAIDDTGLPFPSLGTSMPGEYLPDAAAQWDLLKKLPLTYYRVSLYLAGDWRIVWQEALRHSEKLNIPLALVLYFADPRADIREVLEAFCVHIHCLHSVLLLSAQADATPGLLAEYQLALIREALPRVPAGTGTDRHFAEWNRAVPGLPPSDFTTFPVMPQVHAKDTRSLIENLAAQRDTLVTAARRMPGVPVQVSPINLLRSSGQGDRPCEDIDTRQCSLFAAAWTAVSLHYLSGASAVTYYEGVGHCGLVPGSGPSLFPGTPETAAVTVYPVYLLLRLVGVFRPDVILDSRSDHPLDVDGLALGKKDGGRLLILSNFSEEPRGVTLDVDVPYIKQLQAQEIFAVLAGAETFIADEYAARKSTDLLLPSYSLTFLTNQPHHGR